MYAVLFIWSPLFCLQPSVCCILILSGWRYLKERKQFGAPLAAFQINQQKLVEMLGNIQAMTLVGWRLCKLYEKGKMTPGHASLAKVNMKSGDADSILLTSHNIFLQCISGMDHLEGKGDSCSWAWVTRWQWNLGWFSSCKGFHFDPLFECFKFCRPIEGNGLEKRIWIFDLDCNFDKAIRRQSLILQ